MPSRSGIRVFCRVGAVRVVMWRDAVRRSRGAVVGLEMLGLEWVMNAVIGSDVIEVGCPVV